MNILIPEILMQVLSGVAIFLAAVTLIWFLKPLRTVGAYKLPERNPVKPAPKLSVIVYSQGHEDKLMEYLDTLTKQDYPDYEVIVVSESTAESNEILSESCARRYPNVYVTFIPPGSHNLSRRKLALTLGMKAARGEVVVTTVSNARIPSEHWFSEMAAPFRGEDADRIEVALGYTRIDFSSMHGWGKWYREFNSLLTDVRWIGYALNGKPYRGDGYNLAFRRQVFFDHKGYSRSIYLHPGDDDIFISEIANGENTAMVLSPDSMLTIEWGDAATRMWRARKEQYDFTSRWLPRMPFLMAGAASLMQWVILLCVAVAILLPFLYVFIAGRQPGLDEFLMMIMPLTIWCLFQLFQILIYRKGAAKLGAKRLWWSVGPFWLAKPVLNFYFRLRYRRQLRNNFTWLRN